MIRPALLLFLCSGCFGDKPYGAPFVFVMGTLETGDVYVDIGQPWTHDEGINVKTRGVLIDPDGHDRAAPVAPSLLAGDCSDEPVALGPCIAPTTMRIYPLADGGRIDWVGSTLERLASDGTVLWTLTRATVFDVIRGGGMLIADANAARRISIADGQPIWSYDLPSGL